MTYEQIIIDYILTHESEDFWHWVDLDSDDALEEDERVLLMKQGCADYQADCLYELDVTIMRRLANHHIFAAAYLLHKGVRS